MPLHDWTRVPAALYHDFRQGWAARLSDAINRRLPPDLSAVLEPSGGLYPGVDTSGLTDTAFYAGRASRIAIKHRLSRTVAVIELVSPGNKDSRPAFRDFVDKMVEFVNRGIHLLVIDPFPPGPRDPSGVHKALWDEIGVEEPFEFPAGKDRLLVSYVSASERVAYVEPVGVGDQLPDRPVFLTERVHVPVPLGPAYEEAWAVCPEPLREAVLTGVLPADEDDAAGPA